MAADGEEAGSASSLTWLGGKEEAEKAAAAKGKDGAVETGQLDTNGAKADGEKEAAEEEEEEGLEAFGDGGADAPDGVDGEEGEEEGEDEEQEGSGEAAEGSLLSKLEGFWVDCKHSSKGYMIRGKWCSVWRKGWQSNQHHKLYVVGEDIYWGAQHNFYMQWKDDDTITWFTTNENVEKFSWYRSEGPPTAYSGYSDQWESGKGSRKGKSGYAKAAYSNLGPAGLGTKHVACKFFMRGPDRCANGDQCYFSHDPLVIKEAKAQQNWWWAADTWGSNRWASHDAGWYEGSWGASSGKGRGKGTGKGKGKSKSRSAWSSWDSEWWGQDASASYGASGTDSMGSDERWLLDTVSTMIEKAPDGLNISFLGTKFSANFQNCVRPGEAKNDGAFKAWLASTGRFKFMPDPVHKNLCLVLLK